MAPLETQAVRCRSRVVIVEESNRFVVVANYADQAAGEEQLIRRLLGAAHPGLALPRATDVPDTTPDDPAQTPETYLGTERQQGYAGPTAYATGQFRPPAALPSNSFALAGSWTIGQESITAGTAPGSRSPSTPRASISTSEAPARSPSPAAARARPSASPAPPTSTPSPPSSPPGTAP
jgi:hypothetical protein